MTGRVLKRMTEIGDIEAKLLTALRDLGGKIDLRSLAERTGLDPSALMRSALKLSEDGMVTIEKKTTEVYRTTEEGAQYATSGLPEHRAVEKVIEKGGYAPLSEILGELNIDPRLTPIILGWVKRKNLASIERVDDQIVLKATSHVPERSDEEMLKKIHDRCTICTEGLTPLDLRAIEVLKKRNLIFGELKTEWTFSLTDKGFKAASEGLVAEAAISQLTAEDIATGRWRRVKLRRYNIQAPVQIHWPGKLQPYNIFLDDLKMKLVALGFQEMTGPTIEYMFFNCDALFMPQDHPAREIHDMYFIEEPRYGSLNGYEEYLRNVKESHEKGWGTGSKGWRYQFKTRESARLILRSHGTAISARMLVNKSLRIPGKYFSVARCYRPEVTDRTHLSEFNQVEGIVVAEDLTLRDLLGVLERFAVEIAGAEKVRFKPDYFPFTEPSIELQAYKKDFGWIEFGGSGIFRPELTLPLGIHVPVLAWGLGVDRLFMMKSGVQDIRDLFTPDLNWMRTRMVF